MLKPACLRSSCSDVTHSPSAVSSPTGRLELSTEGPSGHSAQLRRTWWSRPPLPSPLTSSLCQLSQCLGSHNTQLLMHCVGDRGRWSALGSPACHPRHQGSLGHCGNTVLAGSGRSSHDPRCCAPPEHTRAWCHQGAPKLCKMLTQHLLVGGTCGSVAKGGCHCDGPARNGISGLKARGAESEHTASTGPCGMAALAALGTAVGRPRGGGVLGPDAFPWMRIIIAVPKAVETQTSTSQRTAFPWGQRQRGPAGRGGRSPGSG